MLSIVKIQENRRHIMNNLMATNRKGIEKLVKYMDDNGFFNAPASKSHHQNYLGGLSEHSIGVQAQLFKEVEISNSHELIKPESIVISSLLHDLCKIDQYIIESEIKSGNKVIGYVISSNRDANWGHAEKSISIAKQFIELTEEEEEAIRYHMGIYRKDYSWDDFGKAIEKYPLVYLLHVADMKDTYGI